MHIPHERVGDWMQTFTGRQFWPVDPRADEVNIEDIAHSLSMQCRYGGHSIRFYSVAEHCVHVANYVSGPNRLWGLLHDASEAYLSDVIRPLKPYLTGYAFREQKVMRAITEHFGLPEPEPAEVKEADNRILLDERAQNMAPTPHDWKLQGGPLGVTLKFWSPPVAKAMFLETFDLLTSH